MKRVLSMLLMVIMLASLFSSFSVFAADEVAGEEPEQKNAEIEVKNKTGFASQAVTVAISIDNAKELSAATLKIEYDKALELLSVENGAFFSNMAPSAIYAQDVNGINGEYTYVGYGNGDNIDKTRGTIVTLTFKLPDNAKFGNSYQVKVVSNKSSLITGIDGHCEFSVIDGKISALASTACSTHSFSEYTVISQKASYTKTAYKYRTCTKCNVAEVVKADATEVKNVFTYEGVAINYTGKPSGIAPVFTVDKSLSFTASRIEASQKGTKVDAGIIVYKNGEYYTEEIFFGDSTTISLNENNKLFIKIENESVFAKFEFKAYIRITDTETKDQRYIYTTATYKDKEQISIVDVVRGLKINVYPKEDREYLNKVLNGMVQ